MRYEFRCQSCGAVEDKSIRIEDYDKAKDKQTCDKCGCKMERVIEWHGMAKSSGDGWCGKSTGNAI